MSSGNFLELCDFSQDELRALLDLSVQLKQLYKEGGRDTCLAGKTMAMVFEKPSSRTRISFQVGMAQLGGSSIYLRPEDIGGLGVREPIKDLMRVLNGYVDVVVARTFGHDSVVELAEYATISVINALSDYNHPCQAMADMLTIQEHLGDLSGRKLVYVGDGNNVARSLGAASVKLGLQFVVVTPKGYELDDEFLAKLARQDGSGSIECASDPAAAVHGADVIYTDTWTSMGQEEEKEKRIKDFTGFQVNNELLSKTGKNPMVMHCLPAYRGLEITDEVIEAQQKAIFDQAENRLHFQRALLKHLCG